LSDEQIAHPSILIALGDRSRSLLWAITAENSGYSCYVASSAAEAIEKLTKEPWRLLIVGDDLPDGRGRAIAAKARTLNPRPRIFGVVESELPRHRLVFDEAAVDEVVIKSVSPGHIETLLRIWLSQGKPTQA
jgi:DNA-binding response OmpR family regulator